LIAVLAMSSSAVLVRFMDAAPLTIAMWRMTGAAALTAPFARRGASAGQRVRLLAGAALLAVHFVTWFAAVQRTTVLHAAVLVALVPLWTGIHEWVAGEPPRRRFLAGCGIALAGVAGMSAADSAGVASLSGDALAIAAGMAYAGVLAVTRDARTRLGTLELTFWLCGGAAAFLAAGAFATGTPLAVDRSTALLLGLAVLGPQLVGHQGVAWAVRWVPASRVSAVLLLEPVGSALLALLLLGERPAAWAPAAAIAVGLGVALAMRR
jgi:drug/metabolite transporter (DMT)-like permease